MQHIAINFRRDVDAELNLGRAIDASALARASQAAASRCWAGIHFPVDNDAGLMLGRSVGYLVTAVARADGSEGDG
jgi:hypothetical protein